MATLYSRPKHTTIAALVAYLTALDLDGLSAPLYGSGNLSSAGIVGFLRWDATAEKALPLGHWDLTRCDGTEFLIGTDIVKVGSPTLDWTDGMKVTPSGNAFEGVKLPFLNNSGTSTPHVRFRAVLDVFDSSAGASSVFGAGLYAANGEWGGIGAKNDAGQWKVGLTYGPFSTAPSFSSARNTTAPGSSTDVSLEWSFSHQLDATNMAYFGQLLGGNLTAGAAKASSAVATAFGLGSDGNDEAFCVHVGQQTSGTLAVSVKNFTAEVVV